MLTSTHPPRPSTTADLFTRAVRAQVSGDFAKAKSLYHKVIEASPDHAEALNNLGALLAGRGDRDAAKQWLLRAIEVNPTYGEALNNLGLLANESRDFLSSLEYFRRATEVGGDNADWLNNLGNACVETSRFEQALAAYDHAIALRPGEPKFWSNRGIALRGVRRPADAVASFQQALALDPAHVNALGNVGVVLREEKRFQDAVHAFERAIAIEPGNAALIANYASVYEHMGDFETMRDLARRALSLDASHAEAWNLLANYELESARYDVAESLYWKTIAIDPENRNANWNLAIIWLMRGDYERGWIQFEWRRRLQSVLTDTSEFPGPEWDGSPLDGRTVLLATEQGAGDIIQFIRYAGELKRAGAGTVIVECADSVAQLLRTAPGVDRVIVRGTPFPEYDTWACLMSLPRLMGTRVETIPADVPYVVARSRPAARSVPPDAEALRIGIVWSGNPVHKRDFLRSVDLACFAALFDVPGTRFHSLQKGAEAEQQVHALSDSRLVDLAPHMVDFLDTAAVIQQLDLVITVDTSVAHLAGAMGKPVWILLSHVPDFRWLLDREDSPWYPTARLFRQSRPRHWDDVFDRLRQELGAMVEFHRSEVCSSGIDGGDSPCASEPADTVTVLHSATRYADGRPRFEVLIPLARLADPAWFDAWQAELVAGGYQRILREFWDEAAHTVDAVVDLAPFAGLTALSLLTAPNAALCIIAVEPDIEDAERLRGLVREIPDGHRVSVVASSAEAIDRLAALGIRRAGVHALHVAALQHFAASLRAAAWLGDVDIVTHAAGNRIETAATCFDGLTPFAVTWSDGETQLDALTGAEGDVDVAWLSSRALDALGGAEPEERSADSTVSVAIPFAGLGVATEPVARRLEVGIDWELRSDTGWGVYGANLAMELSQREELTPAIFAADERSLPPAVAWRLAESLRTGAMRRAALGDPAVIVAFDGLMLRGFGNNFSGSNLWGRVRAPRNVGMIFFEDTHFDADALEKARSLDLIVAGSTWNAAVLRDAGLTHVTPVFQGTDPTVFHPAPRSCQLAGRFVVFSGGKLEYRKGQDIVVAAFRRFRDRHPEALLVTAWHNAWPHLIADLDLAGHVRGAPHFNGQSLQIREWLSANGVPLESTMNVGCLPNAMMGAVVREADVALFPNRCEGGTNLVAMECMAAGVPTIVSANTGHMDLVETAGCIVLGRQGTVKPPTRFYRATEGWGESDVEEIVDALEKVWSDREAAAALGARAADVMRDWTWPRQIDRLLTVLTPITR